MPHQITSALIGILLAATIVWLVRYNRLHSSNAGWWIILAVVIAIVGALPGLVDVIAATLGISYPPILAVLIAMAVIVLKLLKSDIDRSEEQQQLRLLARKIALLEAKIRSADDNERSDNNRRNQNN